LFQFLNGTHLMQVINRTHLSIAVLAIASLTLPSLAQAKRLGGGVKGQPSAAAPAKAPVAPTAPAAKAPTPPAAPAAPAATAAPAAGSGMMGTMGAMAVGAMVGSMAGNALASPQTPEQKAAAEKAAADKAAQAGTPAK
jgi:hypothetical protein